MGAQIGAKGGMSEINMTPLIDIVLVVLIIMMVNMPIEIESLGVKVPGPVETTPPPPPDPNADQLVVEMYKDGTFALNRRLMTDQQLFYEITRRLRSMDNKDVFIDADTTAKWRDVVHIMDTARLAGAAKVGLARLKKDQAPQAPTSVAAGSAPRGMTLGTPVVVGALDQVQADSAIQPWKATLEKCYLEQLPLSKEMNGRVMGRVSVGPKGEIMDHKITSSTLEGGDPAKAVETCVDSVLGQLKFEPLGDQKTALAQFPLLYSPG
jgi:biopolymer transport protein ExbD